MTRAELDRQRLALIRGGDAAGFLRVGTGYLIGRRLVLAARHVVEESKGMPWAQIDVRVGHPQDADARRCLASVRWTDPEERDVALLLLDDEVDVPKKVRWGRPVGNTPLSYQGLGYPSATFRDGQHKVEYLSGKLPPQAGGIGAQDLYVLDQEFAPDMRADGEQAWSGASGSAVFCQDHLVGVVIHDDHAFANRRLHACPARTFTGDPAFAALLQRYGDGPPELVDITGQLPFQAPDTVGYLTAHLTQEPLAPSSVSTNIPPAWDNLVLTLLHKDPDQRYPNATELSQALRQLDRVQEPESPAGHEARNILLARMARAMSTSLARRAALSQDAGGNGAVQITQSQVKTTVQMSPTAPLASFDLSWTGQDPLSTYAARPRVVATWFTALLSSAIAVASFYLPLNLGLVTPGATDGQDGWLAITLVGGVLGGLVALGSTAGAITKTFVISKHAGARKAISQWALHVDPRGIATGSAAGRREIPWDQIQRVSIEEIQGSSPYRYTGIHIDLEHGASRLTMLRPAGWPYPQPDTVKARLRVPVCVLGPMTERQRTELIEALAGYGGQRWFPSVHFTTLPVDL